VKIHNPLILPDCALSWYKRVHESTSQSLSSKYRTPSHLAHEQRHKTYATLLAEYLGCQFRLPFSFIGTDQINIFVGDFEQQLRNETERFFSSLLGEKYRYNLSAWWYPLRGVPFGGEFSIGEHPPTKDSYVAQSFFMMPYTPVFSLGNHTIIFTKHWLKHQLFDNDVGLGRSTIPAIANMTIVFENYTNKQPPYDTRQNATRATKENLSDLVYGFLIDGIINESNVTVFPGIVHTTLEYGFEKIKNMTGQFLDKALNESFGASIRTIDTLFSGLNSSVANPLSQAILMQLNTTLGELFNGSFDSLNDAFDGFRFRSSHPTGYGLADARRRRSVRQVLILRSPRSGRLEGRGRLRFTPDTSSTPRRRRASR